MLEPSQPLSTDSAQLVAVQIKSANTKIFRALLSLASAALLIRVGGLFNQVVVTGHFGAGASMDAYFVASTLPILMAQLIGSAAESSVIPVYTSLRSRGRKEQASILFNTLLNLSIVGAVVLTLIILIFRREVIFLTAPGINADVTSSAISLSPFIFPALLLMVLIGFMECILNSEGQFGWPAYAGMLVPLTTALLVLTLGNSLGVVILCIGTLAGLCLQLGVIIQRARHAGISYRFVVNLRSPGFSAVMIAAWPALFSIFITQASPLIDQIFASYLSAGNISTLSYALKLDSVPVGVIFVSVGRAALPYLARQASINNMKAFKETLRLYLWLVGISTVVLTAFMIVLAHPIVQLFFQRGAFTVEDTNRTAIALIGFLIGLTPMSFGFIISKAFSAIGKTRLLMYVTIFTVIANAFFDYIFYRWWQGFGIALATSAVYFCTMFILLITLRHTIGKLYLFTPPTEVMNVISKLSKGKYYGQGSIRKEGQLTSFYIPYSIRRQIARIGIIIAAFTAGVIGIFLNPLYALRAAFGSVIIVAFLRYRYALLITWALINTFIGSTLQIFNGNNLLSGLTIPTLLLMFCMPIKQTFKRMPVLAILFVYLLWVFASIGISAIGVGSFLTIWLTFLDYVAIGVLTINLITSRQRMLGLIDAILIPSTFIALYGIYGYITRQNGVVDPTTSFRIFSIFSAAPALALFLSIVIPLAIYRTYTLSGYKRVGGLILILVFLVALVLTFTRGAFISVPLSIILMIFFLPSRKLKIGLLSSTLVLATLVVLLSTVGHVPIFERFFSADITTFNGRLYLWQTVLDNFDPTKLLGNGLQASDLLLTNLRVASSIATAPSNLFVGTLYDHGIIGLILLTLVFITLFISLIAGMRKATGDHRVLFAAALAVFVNMLLQSLESRDFWSQANAIYFWIIMALPFALCWYRPKQSSEIKEDILKESRMGAIQLQRGEREQVSTV